METAAAAAAAGTTPMPTPATVNAAAPSQQSGAQQAAIPGVWRSIIKEAELDHYLDTFRLTRGIHKKVDVSNDALDKLFDLLDREEADHLIKTQFVEGINRCLYAFGGLALPPHLPALDTLWAEASVLLDDEDGQRRGLPRPAFGRIVRRLKMEILLPQHPPRAERPSHAVTATTAAAAPFLNKTPSTLGFLRKSASSFAAPAAAGAEDGGVGVPSACEEVDMKMFDFTKRQMRVRDVSEAKLRDFFLGRRVKDTILRWIMVECHDYLNIMRLANKFRIHSLLLEDLLKLETQKAKVTAHSGNNFVVFPTLRLSRETERALKAWGERDREDGGGFWRSSTPPFPIRLEEATAGVFAVGAARSADEQEEAAASAQPGAATGDTVITIRTTWRAISTRTGQMVMRKEFAAERMVRHLNPMAALRRMGAGSSVPSFATTPSSGASGATSNSSQTASSTTGTGTGAQASLTGTTRRRNLMMATMRQGLRQGLSSTTRESGLERGAVGGAARGASKPLHHASSMGLRQSSSIPLKDLLSPRRRAPAGSASGPASPASYLSLPDVAVGKGGVAKVRVLPEKRGNEDDNDARRRRVAQAEEWEELFEQGDEDGDDGESLTSEAEEDDWYFDAQMMMEVSEAVYQTNASISGNTAQWLLHSILDHTVDRLLPIVEAYQVRVAYFQDTLYRRAADFGKTQTSEVMDTKLDLLWIHRRVALLKPLLKHLLRTVPADLQLYYQDIDDHLDRCLEGLSELGNTAQSIVEEAHHNRENRINEILFTITIVTATFVPANFIAGVFGTNFSDGEKPTMPELTWKHGYLWFWLSSFLASFGVVLLVKYQMNARKREWAS